MKRYRIPKTSAKQRAKNAEVARIKKQLPKVCCVCGDYGNDAAHLLPKSTFPEYYTEPKNIVILCRKHHNLYDNDIEFRKRQTKLFRQAISVDLRGSIRHFNMDDDEIRFVNKYILFD